MKTPYDPMDLLARMESHGLDVAEIAARDIVEAVFSWVTESAKLSPSPLDDVVLLVMPRIKEEILKKVDAIDGKKGA